MTREKKRRKPSLRTLIIGATAGAFVVMLLFLFAVFTLSMEKFLTERESDNIQNQASLAEAVLDSSVSSLPSVTRDWSSWDLTYDYVQGRYDEFLDDYLTDYPLMLFRLNIITVLDEDSRPVYERFFDYRAGEAMADVPDLAGLYDRLGPATAETFTPSRELTLVDSGEIGLAGFVEYENAVYYLSSYPILRSDETGPVAGTLVFGRLIDAAEIASLTENTGASFTLGSPAALGLSDGQLAQLGEGGLVTTGRDTVTSHLLTEDIFGEPLVITSASPRTLFEQGRSYITLIVLVVAAFCIVILAIILILLGSIVTKPLAGLVSDMNGIGANSSGKTLEPRGGSREMDSLANAANGLLSRIREDRDIIKSNNERLLFHANYDLLTSLRNRFSTTGDLEAAISDAALREGTLAVFFIDLDRFKYINDTMGHAAGDDLIIQIADRLREAFEGEAQIARTGGDEFFITVKGFGSQEERLVFAERIFRLFRRPFRLRHRDFLVSASIGSAAYPIDGTDAAALTKNAEVAMYRAKDQGEGHYMAYQKDFHDAMERKIFLENEMRDCISDAYRSFSAHFQPKLDLVTGRITSCEALMRWRLPGENISPIEFIPLAEESGLIIPLSWWMLGECCRMGKLFSEQGIDCHIAINMSAQVLLHDDFLPVLRSTVARTGMDLSRIDIEIIESTLVADVEKVNVILRELHALGAEISVDDFGTGYSSLSYLNKMAVDRIKIDRSFISKLNESTEEQELVTTIINMGKNLHMVVTAEGVEDEGQFQFLRNASCDEIQGYLISPALPGDVFMDFVEEWEQRLTAKGAEPIF